MKTKREKLKTHYNDTPLARIPGWQIVVDDEIGRPVAIVPEPTGGIKNEQGRSPYQEQFAYQFAASTDLLEAAEKVLKGLDRQIKEAKARNIHPDGVPKFEGLAELRKAIAKSRPPRKK